MISDAFGYTFDPCSYSDHDLVSVKFNCERTFARGPGLSKFNSGLTMDDEYTTLLSQLHVITTEISPFLYNRVESFSVGRTSIITRELNIRNVNVASVTSPPHSPKKRKFISIKKILGLDFNSTENSLKYTLLAK